MKDLAGSYLTIQHAVGGLRDYICHFNKPKKSSHNRSEHKTANKVHAVVFTGLHSAWGAEATLKSVGKLGDFGGGDALTDKQKDELLSFEAIGRERLSDYIENHVVYPPRGRPVKTTHSSIHTFAAKAERASTRQTSKAQQLSKTNKALMLRLHKTATSPESVYPTPQAISNHDGTFPNKTKSDARKELLDCLSHTGDFTNKKSGRGELNKAAHDLAQPLNLTRLGPKHMQEWCATLNPAANQFATVVDGLGIIHKPPSPGACTYLDWFQRMVRSGITAHLENGSSTVVLLLDRPADLPPPRAILHAKRATGLPPCDAPDNVELTDPLPKNKTNLAKWLASPTFKQALIKTFTEYITGSNPAAEHADFNCLKEGQTVVVDSAAIQQPWGVTRTGADLQALCNDHALRQAHTHGEADLSAWHFAQRLEEPVVIMEAADTDWFFYGLAWLEASPSTRKKEVLIHRMQGKTHEYDHLNIVLQQLCEKADTQCQQLKQPAAQLLFVYLMSGSDYIPGFKHVSFMSWWELLLTRYAFVTTTPATAGTAQQGQTAHHLPIVVVDRTNASTPVVFNVDSAARLISAHYFSTADKQARLVRHTTAWPLAAIYQDITTSRNRAAAIMDAISDLYPDKKAIPSAPGDINTWLDVVHRHSFSKMKADDRTMPPPAAVQQQVRRCVYVSSLVYNTLFTDLSPIKQQHLSHGWMVGEDGTLTIDWGVRNSTNSTAAETNGTAADTNGTAAGGRAARGTARKTRRPAGRAAAAAAAARAGSDADMSSGADTSSDGEDDDIQAGSNQRTQRRSSRSTKAPDKYSEGYLAGDAVDDLTEYERNDESDNEDDSISSSEEGSEASLQGLEVGGDHSSESDALLDEEDELAGDSD